MERIHSASRGAQVLDVRLGTCFARWSPTPTAGAGRCAAFWPWSMCGMTLLLIVAHDVAFTSAYVSRVACIGPHPGLSPH